MRAMEFGSVEEGIEDISGFHANIVDHIENNIDEVSSGNILCILIDEEGNEFESLLDEEQFEKSLKKTLDFFKKTENYEKCQRITDLIERI